MRYSVQEKIKSFVPIPFAVQALENTAKALEKILILRIPFIDVSWEGYRNTRRKNHVVIVW